MDNKWLDDLPLASIRRVYEVQGGDVNQAYHLETNEGDYFLLVQPNRSEVFFASEIAGLQAFKAAGIRAPEVIASGEIQDDAYLLLEFLQEGRGSQGELGQLVAKLHRQHQPDSRFGFHLPHHGGAISFDNQWTVSWVELFVYRRLDVLCDALVAKGRWKEAEANQYTAVREQIIHELTQHASEASLLHGDLWSGNYMFLSDGTPALFDPSPLYGDREFDIGITTVFGGFSSEFYEVYQQDYPMTKGWEHRLKYYRLYLWLVHLDKFGESYAASVQREMDEILAI